MKELHVQGCFHPSYLFTTYLLLPFNYRGYFPAFAGDSSPRLPKYLKPFLGDLTYNLRFLQGLGIPFEAESSKVWYGFFREAWRFVTWIHLFWRDLRRLSRSCLKPNFCCFHWNLLITKSCLRVPPGPSKDGPIWIGIQNLGGGNSKIFYFHPEPWGDDPIWLMFFEWGWNHQLVMARQPTPH